MKKISDFLATGLYVGYFPLAPGTFGSATISMILWIASLNYHLGIAFKVILLVLISGVGLLTTAEVLKNTKEKDPGYIVIDEWAGQLTAYLLVPLTLETIVVGFIFFRIFDILKIYPVNKAENLRGEYGIMFDDIVAGIYAGILLFLWNIWI